MPELTDLLADLQENGIDCPDCGELIFEVGEEHDCRELRHPDEYFTDSPE